MQYIEQTEIEDQLFPSDNILEVPTLREDMQAKAVQIPFVCFGEQRRTYDMQGTGTLHFYTDDYRFRAIYEHPDRILQHNPANIVEPNFSLFNDTPIAFGLQHIYKKRFLARACQEKGIKVFVDLNVAPKYYKVNLLGVPRGWSSYCTRGYQDRINQTAFELEMARQWADGNPLTFVVYGGGKPVQQFCRDRCRRSPWFRSRRDSCRGHRRGHGRRHSRSYPTIPGCRSASSGSTDRRDSAA